MTANDAAPDRAADADYDAPGICQVCGGPCRQWKGSVHGYTCRACLEVLMDDGARRWERRSARAREKVVRNVLHGNDNPTLVTASGDRRRDGGGQQLRAAPPLPASIPTTTPNGRDAP
jgi:hypothetical protein